MELIIVMIIGSIIGSFSNVIIYRVPRKESIAFPSSHCPVCNKDIKWYDNIPIFSYLFLKGKCRSCGSKIPVRYFIVEVLMTILYGIAYLKFKLSWEFALALIFITVSIWITFIDFEHYIIPNVFVAMILATGVFRVIKFIINNGDVTNNILGFIVGFVILYTVRVIGRIIYKREAMGFGDVKLSASAGLFLGAGNILLTFLLSTIIAAIVEVTLLKLNVRKKGQEVAFGPYLVMGMIISLFLGDKIIGWYLGLLG